MFAELKVLEQILMSATGRPPNLKESFCLEIKI